MAGENSQLSILQQQVRTRLAFLGMPQGDVCRFVELATKVANGGTEVRAFQAEMKRLCRALSRQVGKPRADLFVKWLTEKIPDASKSNSKAESSQNAVPLEHLQPSGDTKAKTVSPSGALVDSSNNENVTPNRQVFPDETNVLDEAWVEVKSKEGKSYYWDRASNSVKWALPAGVRAKWVSHKSAEGRTYYCNRDGGGTVWTMPPLQVSTSTPLFVSQTPVLATVEAAPGPSGQSCSEPETFRMCSPSKENSGANCKSLRGRSRSPRRGPGSDADLKLKLEQRLTAIKAAIKSSAPKTSFENVTVFEHMQNRRAMSGGA